jgi:hypothetical protein
MGQKVWNILGVEMDPEIVKSPYQFYRTLRPENFSDSRVEQRMSRLLFKQVMAELSAEMKQDDFEEFTYQLVRRIISPNLVPQTGPMGGGDGKVDFETYAVDKDVACKWYTANANRGDERWAFAISCVATWEQKIKRDIANALSTQKEYSRFYFCTNQLVPARKKLEIQKDFKEKYHLDTYILDRNWYEKAVFDDKCYQIAIDTLHLGKELEEVVVEGPLDKQRKIELAEIEERIQQHQSHDGLDTDYVNDLLSAAILSRELERPWSETIGRFNTALNEAQKNGLRQQIFEIHYQLGWTEFYWYEHPKAMLEQYRIIKTMLTEEINPVRIEKVFNLLNVTRTAYGVSLLTNDDVDIRSEEKEWYELSEKIANNPNLPASALYMQLLQLDTALMAAIQKKQPIDKILETLLVKVDEAQNYIDISLDSYGMIIEEVGRHIEDNPLYETLVDKIAEIRKKHEGDFSFSRTHLYRGSQNLGNHQYVAAVKHLGKCIVGFQHEESRKYLIQACGLLAEAFNNLDLLNAAKIFFTRSLSLLLHEATNSGDFNHLIVTIQNELCRIALRQGDLNEFLNWYVQLEKLLSKMPQYRDDKYVEEHTKTDAILSALLLRSSIDALPPQMPDVFERLGLMFSSDILLYRLGYPEKMSTNFKENIGNVENWSKRWMDMVPSGYFLYPLHVQKGKETEVRTLVKGCRITAVCENNIPAISFAHLELALIESYFSTADITDISFMTSNVKITVKTTKGKKSKVGVTRKSNEYVVTINPDKKKEQERYETAIMLLAHVLTKNARHRNQEEFFTQKEAQEKLGERLALMAGHLTDVENSQMIPYLNSIESWINSTDDSYPNKAEQSEPVADENVGEQANNVITDLIDVPLWDKAKWSGCGYMTTRDYSRPPVMIFMYKDMTYGKRIFEAWEEKFDNNQLNITITIILGIDKDHPYWYKVLVNPDVDSMLRDDKDKGRYVMAVSRFHLMQAQSNLNLEMFRSAYKDFSYAGISAAEIDGNQLSSDGSKWYPRVIPIRKITFREAWTIGEHDLDSPAIQPDDNPIIPEAHKTDAPILKLLERKRQYAQR